MNQTDQTKAKSQTETSGTMQAILEELRLLRSEVSLLLPQEDLNGYENPKRIVNSYKEAIKEHPPATYGNN